jgi:hypothetical protein
MPDDSRRPDPISEPLIPPGLARERRELNEVAPFLSWTVLYLIVAVALALEIVAFAAIHWIYR